MSSATPPAANLHADLAAVTVGPLELRVLTPDASYGSQPVFWSAKPKHARGARMQGMCARKEPVRHVIDKQQCDVLICSLHVLQRVEGIRRRAPAVDAEVVAKPSGYVGEQNIQRFPVVIEHEQNRKSRDGHRSHPMGWQARKATAGSTAADRRRPIDSSGLTRPGGEGADPAHNASATRRTSSAWRRYSACLSRAMR